MSARAAGTFADAAEALAGTPFRLHGRDPATGIDCVGLVASALARCGRRPLAPEGYTLRAVSVAPLLRFAARNGFVPVAAETAMGRGDLVLFKLHAIQAHLAIALEQHRLVHAHAGLGRVVIEERPVAWPIVARWRLQPEGDC